MSRAILIVLDGVGVGAAPDAAAFGDEGSDSIGNTSRRLGELVLPNLGTWGLGHLTDIQGTPPFPSPRGGYGKIAEVSAGKDSTTGHWEMCGIITRRPFPTYPNGFPPEVMSPFEHAIGHRALGNRAASGTEIIQELGDEHRQSGAPIVYTSADSVFQVATHEAVVPVEKLYEWCQIARGLLDGEHRVGRVIARPFSGESGAYARTSRRRDFTVPPPRESLLDILAAAGIQVIGVGKIEDLFSGKGIALADHTTSNAAGMSATLRWLQESAPECFLYVNLNDFDTLWGHRNDVDGYARGLEAFDSWLPRLWSALDDEDLLMVTSDHGNDPTTAGTDHSREFVPLLASLGPPRHATRLGTRHGMQDIAATVLEHFGLPERMGGQSFRRDLEAE